MSEQNKWSEMDPERKERYREASRCRTRALRQLAKIHKDEYATLCRAEFAKAGIEVNMHRMSETEKKYRQIERLRQKLAALETEVQPG